MALCGIQIMFSVLCGQKVYPDSAAAPGPSENMLSSRATETLRSMFPGLPGRMLNESLVHVGLTRSPLQKGYRVLQSGTCFGGPPGRVGQQSTGHCWSIATIAAFSCTAGRFPGTKLYAEDFSPESGFAQTLKLRYQEMTSMPVVYSVRRPTRQTC